MSSQKLENSLERAVKELREIKAALKELVSARIESDKLMRSVLEELAARREQAVEPEVITEAKKPAKKSKGKKSNG